jgi:hypothetical protein
VTHQRPVPRTLSDILKRLKKPGPSREPAGTLMSPEALSQTKAPITDPNSLFKGVKARPPSKKELLAQAIYEEIIAAGMTDPENIFGNRALAKKGQKLAAPHALDLEPTQPMAPIILAALEDVHPPDPPLIPFVDDLPETEDPSA